MEEGKHTEPPAPAHDKAVGPKRNGHSLMGELQAQELEELVQRLEEEYGAEESLPHDVEDFLHVLQSGTAAPARQDAAEQLGNVQTSSRRIVRALIAAYESDPSSMVNRAAAKSLDAPVHHKYLVQHTDVIGETERAIQQAPAKGETDRGGLGQQSRSLILCLVASPIAGLVVGWVIGRWYAEQPGEHAGCGAPFVAALAIGAVVGPIVGAVLGGIEQERSDRITGIIISAFLAAVVAALSCGLSWLLRILQLGGP
jgi:hypothetical protein